MLASLKSQGFEIVTVNSGDNADVINKLWNTSKFAMRAVMNGDKVSETYNVTAIPTNYLVGADGKILAVFLGFDPDGIKTELAKHGIKGQ